MLVTLSNIGVNITAAIASLSIGGLAVGLAAQDTLANLFGAVAIFLDKPFKIGDRIQVDNVDGPGREHRTAQHAHPKPGRPSGHNSEQDDGERHHHQHRRTPQHQGP